MISLIASIFFGIGFVVSAFSRQHLLLFPERQRSANPASASKAHEKRLVTLLESINQKLNAKP